jgi:flagellar protein FlaF
LAACTEGVSRIRALGRNHTLWSLLVKDLALGENRLPEGLKFELVRLGLWSMRYSTLAILKNLSLQPVITVNRNVMEGLQAQNRNSLPRHDETLKAPVAV